MKTNDLGKTALILFGTLLVAFALGAWWMSRQAAALRELQTSSAAAKEELRLLMAKRDHTTADIEVLQANVKMLKRYLASSTTQAYLPNLVLHAKRGFNDIEHHVAKGEFAGLALTDGYIELRGIFDNPAFEDMIDGYHAVTP